MAFYSDKFYTIYTSRSIKEINNADSILVFTPTELFNLTEGKTLKLSTLEEIYNSIKENVYTIIRSGSVFKYLHREGGFLYIIPVKNDKPLGYIRYTSIQGKTKDINISFNLTNSNTGIGFNNGIVLGTEKETYDLNRLIGEKPWQYSGGLNECGGNSLYSRYVKNDGPAVLTSLGIYDGNVETNLILNQNFSINPHQTEGLEDNVRFSYYKGDLAVYSWSGDKYAVYSLTKCNKFGLPVSYTPSDTGYYTHTAEIKSWSGNVPNGTNKIDEWDPAGRTITWKNNGEKIYGDWTNTNKTWKNWYGTLTIDDNTEIIPINNRVLLGKNKDDYVIYYDGTEVDRFRIGSKLENTYLFRFRKTYIQTETVPEIIGAISGIIYYRGQNGNIWYL